MTHTRYKTPLTLKLFHHKHKNLLNIYYVWGTRIGFRITNTHTKGTSLMGEEEADTYINHFSGAW